MTSTPHPTPFASMSSQSRRFDPPSPREAFALARKLDAARPPQTTPGHRLYWMTSGSFGSCDLAAASSAAVVVGSHPLCDVRLLDEVSVSLRHLLVRSSLVDDGCPLLSVLDLHTAHGFYLSNGATERSIDATGAIVIRVGGYAIVALPSDRVAPEELPAPICQAALESPYRAATFSPELLARPLDRSSRITLFPRVVDAVESERSIQKHERDIYEITMSGVMGTRTVRVPSRDLRRGILVGRSLDCDPSLRAVVDMGISRGHLLLLKDRHGAIAYDLSSTQGTWFFGRRSRAVELTDSGTVLVIGAGQRITLSWRSVTNL